LLSYKVTIVLKGLSPHGILGNRQTVVIVANWNYLHII